ncbi:ATP-binding protein [Pyrococcus kukulkanii]|uniref:AAA family ATPase n=1 Tax=Pyrococcus kukulkanii TaxID=1609559 RepID=UPI00356544AD
MENPFVFGEPVRGDKFINRKREVERLKAYILSGRNVILYSPRRFGKTSLILKAIEELRNDVIPIFIDCYAITSREELAEEITRKVLKSYSSFSEAVKRLLANIQASVMIKTEYGIDFEVKFKKSPESWKDAIDLPQKLAEDRKKRVVVVFDEFQELSKFEGLLKVLRSKLQLHDKVSYVFVGSKRHLMEWIFRSKESPFYNFAAHMVLKEIPKEDFKAYIMKAFEMGGIEIKEDVVDYILSLTKCHPYYTQRLCFELWYLGKTKGRVRKDDVDEVLEDLVSDLENSFIVLWETLTPNQRKVLIMIAAGEKDLFSGETIRKYNLRSPSSVQSALKKLIEKEIVSKNDTYKISDVFLEYWIRERFIEGKLY